MGWHEEKHRGGKVSGNGVTQLEIRLEGKGCIVLRTCEVPIFLPTWGKLPRMEKGFLEEKP